MHKFDLKGRKLVVKEDTDASRDRYGRITKGDRRDRDRDRDRSPRRDRDRDRDRDRGSSSSGSGNTYGLSPQFLSSLDIDGPLHTRLFVANLAYDVGESKLDGDIGEGGDKSSDEPAGEAPGKGDVGGGKLDGDISEDGDETSGESELDDKSAWNIPAKFCNKI